jgi:hypothetical protein
MRKGRENLTPTGVVHHLRPESKTTHASSRRRGLQKKNENNNNKPERKLTNVARTSGRGATSFSPCVGTKKEEKVEKKNSTGVAAIQLKKKRFQEIRKMVGFVDGVKKRICFIN